MCCRFSPEAALQELRASSPWGSSAGHMPQQHGLRLSCRALSHHQEHLSACHHLRTCANIGCTHVVGGGGRSLSAPSSFIFSICFHGCCGCSTLPWQPPSATGADTCPGGKDLLTARVCDFPFSSLCCQLLQFPNYSSEVGAGTSTSMCMEMGQRAHPNPSYPTPFSGHDPAPILLCSVPAVPMPSSAAQTLSWLCFLGMYWRLSSLARCRSFCLHQCFGKPELG